MRHNALFAKTGLNMTTKNTRFLIASGGTGGHFYPGFAVGKYLHKQGAEVLFLVRKNDPAKQTLAKHNLHFAELDLTGLPRSFNPVRHVRFVKKLMQTLSHTRRIIANFKPDVVLGMGGYISFPLVFCAHRMGIKTALHESNTRMGLSNRICARYADLIMLGLPLDRALKKAVLTSTPLRKEFACAVKREEVLGELGLNPSSRTLLVMGGSQGAKGLNEAVVKLAQAQTDVQFIHLTGEKWFDALSAQYKPMPHVRALAYCHEVYKLMKAADAVICRSGASTVAELTACRLPAILVPFPHAAADHQYYNAKVLQDYGCAVVIRENPHLAEQLQETLASFTPDRLAQMKAAYQNLPLPDALQSTAEIARKLETL